MQDGVAAPVLNISEAQALSAAWRETCTAKALAACGQQPES